MIPILTYSLFYKKLSKIKKIFKNLAKFSKKQSEKKNILINEI